MPAKKDETTEVKKKAAPKKSAAKKTTTAEKVVAPKATKKETAPKKSSSKATKKPAPKAAVLSQLSKGKERKIRIEDKFSGREYHLGVGKRKSAVALVRLYKKGKGEVIINNKEITEYLFGALIENALQPLALSGKTKDFDITVKVEGGGVSSQAEAIRHGIARALVLFDAELRTALKPAGLLTRDSRVKERKKPGLKRARRAPQWKKR